MKQEEFENVVADQIVRCRHLLNIKGTEYVPQELNEEEADRLKHFKKAAVIMNATPKAALMGMLSKHLISVSDMCTDERTYSKKQWDEKITDSINYLLILRALVEEESDEQN